MTIAALIPARGGSKRIPGKNIRRLAGHPLLAYTLAQATQAGIFSQIVVSTESREVMDAAAPYLPENGYLRVRPPAMAQDDSPDFGWVEDALATIEADAFAILRPTSPFRTPESLQAAWESFRTDKGLVDSLRAVRPAREHPGKMWRLDGDRMKPLLPNWLGLQPWHSHQTANLRVFHVQTSSLEIAWTKTVSQLRTISGVSIKPWLVTDPEGFALDYPEDWERAEAKITAGEWALPSVTPN